jgi:undecaprenyl-diphosphatase
MYSIVIQMGAILCLPIYFRKRLTMLIRKSQNKRGMQAIVSHPLALTCVAFIMTAVPSFLLSKVIGKHLESLTIMGISLIVGGIVMWIVDLVNAKAEKAGQGSSESRVRTWRTEDMSLGQAIWIGSCQTLSAVFPGASRSMTTIAAGQLAGMSRSAALEFSFFLSIPTMMAATGYDLLKSVTGKGENPIGISQIDPHGWLVLAIGIVTSFIVAYCAVAWFLAWVRSHGFIPFAFYRLTLGIAVLVWAL